MRTSENKFIKKIKRHLAVKNPLTKYLYSFYIKRFVVKLKKDEVGLINKFNIGETYLLCSMLNYFQRKDLKIVLISTKTNHESIFRLFSSNVERYCIVPDLFTKSFNHCRSVVGGGIFSICHSKLWSEFYCNKNSTQLDKLKELALIDRDAKISLPTISEASKKQAKKLFESLNLKENKTVIVAPEAKSCMSLDRNFYKSLCRKLKEKGYAVFLNVTDISNSLADTKQSFLPIELVVPFADLCGHIISVRSGFCEVASSSNAKFHVIYPDKDFFELFPLNEIVNTKNLNEYILDSDSKITLENVLKHF